MDVEEVLPSRALFSVLGTGGRTEQDQLLSMVGLDSYLTMNSHFTRQELQKRESMGPDTQDSPVEKKSFLLYGCIQL